MFIFVVCDEKKQAIPKKKDKKMKQQKKTKIYFDLNLSIYRRKGFD